MAAGRRDHLSSSPNAILFRHLSGCLLKRPSDHFSTQSVEGYRQKRRKDSVG